MCAPVRRHQINEFSAFTHLLPQLVAALHTAKNIQSVSLSQSANHTITYTPPTTYNDEISLSILTLQNLQINGFKTSAINSIFRFCLKNININWPDSFAHFPARFHSFGGCMCVCVCTLLTLHTSITYTNIFSAQCAHVE